MPCRVSGALPMSCPWWFLEQPHWPPTGQQSGAIQNPRSARPTAARSIFGDDTIEVDGVELVCTMSGLLGGGLCGCDCGLGWGRTGVAAISGIKLAQDAVGPGLGDKLNECGHRVSGQVRHSPPPLGRPSLFPGCAQSVCIQFVLWGYVVQ